MARTELAKLLRHLRSQFRRLGVDSVEIDPKAAAKHLAGEGVQVLTKVRAAGGLIRVGSPRYSHRA
jgi:hypothetical protein